MQTLFRNFLQEETAQKILILVLCYEDYLAVLVRVISTLYLSSKFRWCMVKQCNVPKYSVMAYKAVQRLELTSVLLVMDRSTHPVNSQYIHELMLGNLCF